MSKPQITKGELKMIYGSVALDGSSLTKEQVYTILTTPAEPQRKVRYYWSEDGEPELCDYEKLIIPYELRCYHCYNMIEPGECVKLRNRKGEIYYLHNNCARDGVSFL